MTNTWSVLLVKYSDTGSRGLSFGSNIQTQVHAVCPLGQIFRHRFTRSVLWVKYSDTGSCGLSFGSDIQTQVHAVCPYGETAR